ncbi:MULTISPECIES: hypothetical protein [Rhodococcus]|uniref:hypothetical protein n=1 Tax=Rhodococcus opacus TaxID=37919 RepID=UPI0012DB2597|nr:MULTISPECIES: hypothetical protein [Rhodococcus]UOT01398.1 hypothetical protein MPY17_20510 [Rhodococcus opacus]
MSTRIAAALSAVAITLSLGALTAPTASAAPAVPAATPAAGSVTICFGIPLGSASLNWCF